MEIKKRIEFLIEKAKFDLSAEEKDIFEKDLLEFKDQLKTLDDFDLSNVLPLRQPFEKRENALREDIPEDKFVSEENNKLILANASNSKDGYIFLKREEES